MESSLCEKPERHAPRRLSDHLGLEGLKQKVHSLVDKVYSRTNLTLAWERVRANRGSGGTDGISIEDFEAHLEINLDRLHRELRDGTYQPQPVRRIEIPKRGASGEDEAVRHSLGLRPRVPTGYGQPPGADLRGSLRSEQLWVNYFAVGHSSECFSFVKDWVEKKIKRHMQRARNRQGFGWTRWSREWTYNTLGLFKGYRVVRPALKAVPAG